MRWRRSTESRECESLELRLSAECWPTKHVQRGTTVFGTHDVQTRVLKQRFKRGSVEDSLTTTWLSTRKTPWANCRLFCAQSKTVAALPRLGVILWIYTLILTPPCRASAGSVLVAFTSEAIRARRLFSGLRRMVRRVTQQRYMMNRYVYIMHVCAYTYSIRIRLGLCLCLCVDLSSSGSFGSLVPCPHASRFIHWNLWKQLCWVCQRDIVVQTSISRVEVCYLTNQSLLVNQTKRHKLCCEDVTLLHSLGTFEQNSCGEDFQWPRYRALARISPHWTSQPLELRLRDFDTIFRCNRNWYELIQWFTHWIPGKLYASNMRRTFPVAALHPPPLQVQVTEFGQSQLMDESDCWEAKWLDVNLH